MTHSTTSTTTPQAVTIGAGATIHQGYFVGDNLTGSLCNPYAWESSRVIRRDRPVTCKRCAAATQRAAQQEAAQKVQS